MNYCYQTPKSILPAQQRIVVIGDIHGDWKALIKALQKGKVINKNKSWVGGKTHLVQIGDILDRGGRPSSYGDEQSEYKIIKYLFKLKKYAQRAGGDVHILLGNHEIMNIMGNFRYVSPMGLTDFHGQRREMLKPGGKIAKELACQTNSIIKIGSWLFAHAGVIPNISGKYSIDKVNSIIRNFLLGNTKLSRESELIDFFWHRNYSSTPAKCGLLSRSLQDYESKYMAVGHTVQHGGINSACNGQLWRVDVGLSEAFGNKKRKRRKCQVLEIADDHRVIVIN